MKRFKSLVMAALAVVVAALYATPAVPVMAQSSSTSSSALSIPPKKNYLIEPGKSVKDKLTIRNLDTVNSLNLTLRVIDFTFTDDSGTPKLFLDPNAPQTTWSLKPYMTVPNSVTIPPNGSKTLDMSVAIPAGHGAGSYYSAIIYSAGAPNTGQGANVGLSASGVTLVFTDIPGKVSEDLKLKNFGAYRPATPGRDASYLVFTVDEPQNIAYTLQNNGNVTEAPAGNITLKGWFGAPIQINNVNPTGSLALIGQARTYTACIKLKDADVDFNGAKTQAKTCVSPALWPGIYTASLDLFYGQNGNTTKEVTGSALIFYFPLWFIAILIVVLLVLVYYGWKLKRFIDYKFRGGARPKSRRSRR
jgi:hypothetical protein